VAGLKPVIKAFEKWKWLNKYAFLIAEAILGVLIVVLYKRKAANDAVLVEYFGIRVALAAGDLPARESVNFVITKAFTRAGEIEGPVVLPLPAGATRAGLLTNRPRIATPATALQQPPQTSEQFPKETIIFPVRQLQEVKMAQEQGEGRFDVVQQDVRSPFTLSDLIASLLIVRVGRLMGLRLSVRLLRLMKRLQMLRM
jgi:hypothetical protein